MLTDLSRRDPREILNSVGIEPGEVDGVVGGPPCQGFSYIGKMNPSDERNALIGRFFRFVACAEPAFFVMENVLGILAPDFRFILDQGLEELNGRYNILGPLIFDTSDFGAATKRKRAIFVGYLPDRVDPIAESDLTVFKVSGHVTVEEAIADLPSPSKAARDCDGQYWAKYGRDPSLGVKGAYARRAREAPPPNLGSKHIRENCRMNLVSGFQPTRHTHEVLKRFISVAPGMKDETSKCPRLDWSRQCPTLRAGTGKERGSYQAIRPIHPEENRVISVREAARLQGFPDWFQFHPTIWHSFRMIGNSVSPYLSNSILRSIACKLYAVKNSKQLVYG